MSVKIRLGGVPEHFNLPIHLAKEKGSFDEHGIDLSWTTFGGGTGEMTAALRNNEVDICILLTEGIILDIINGNPSKIISEYVTTPLCWGIHTGISNPLSHHDEIYDKQYAISRIGSGSHLMAIIDAYGQGKQLNDSQFEIINNINGGLASLESEDTDVFYWEKFTTKPFVDEGKIKRIGEFPTPWPSFVICASNAILENNPDKISDFLKVIHSSCDDFMKNQHAVIPMVSERYGLTIKDAENWYHRTEWATNGWVSDKMLQSVVYNLKLAGITDKEKAVPELIWKRN